MSSLSSQGGNHLQALRGLSSARPPPLVHPTPLLANKATHPTAELLEVPFPF